ncbi:MAG: DUF4468 domain-containing protein [Bacteroidales bacterium]|nr:DUF4468 domain-containing protein [Bacteroidales bacterium]
MRKTSLVILFMAVLSMAFSQKNKTLERPNLPMDDDSLHVVYKEVVNQTGTPQELFDRAMQWVKTEYKNTSEVIKSQDRDKGVIELRSSVRIYGKQKDGTLHMRNIVYYKCKIECRDQRYRYTFSDFTEKATAVSPIEVWFDTTNPKWEPAHYEYLNQIDEQVRAVIESMKKGMEPKVEKVDEW